MSYTYDGLTYSSMGSLPKNAEKSSQFLLVRLLSGTASVSNGKFTAKQRTDYSQLPPTLQTKKLSGAVVDFLLTYGVGGDPKSFIQKTIIDNRKFYQDLLGEFSNYYLQEQRGNQTAAFVFLYRILEKLSYSVPLLYCATQRDYVGTFNELKALFDDRIKGELGLFKKFINQGRFIDPIKLDISYQLRFSSSRGHEAKYFDLTRKHHSDYISEDSNTHQLEIKFRQVPELLIKLRNRFFHSLTGEDKHNIRIEEILDPDEFFACVNPVFCSFLSIVTLQTLARKYQS